MKKIGIISCNINNLFSISNAFKKLDFLPVVSDDRKTLLNCDMLVLPGVGAYNVAMKNIKKRGIDNTISDFIKTGKNFLGICLGFQLLFDESEEFIKTKGLGFIPGKVVGFDKKKMIVPHVGWNNVIPKKSNNLINQGMDTFYFVHSFYAQPYNPEDIFCFTNYDGLKFCSGIKKNNITGIQFHPEKSGTNGMNFLKNLLKSL